MTSARRRPGVRGRTGPAPRPVQPGRPAERPRQSACRRGGERVARGPRSLVRSARCRRRPRCAVAGGGREPPRAPRAPSAGLVPGRRPSSSPLRSARGRASFPALAPLASGPSCGASRPRSALRQEQRRPPRRRRPAPCPWRRRLLEHPEGSALAQRPRPGRTAPESVVRARERARPGLCTRGPGDPRLAAARPGEPCGGRGGQCGRRAPSGSTKAEASSRVGVVARGPGAGGEQCPACGAHKGAVWARGSRGAGGRRRA